MQPSQPSQPVVELQVAPDCVPDWFWPLLENTDRYLLLWGGRDSGKSDGLALKLLLAAINLPYFKCVMARKQLNKVFGSIQATLEKVAKREGIDHLFRFGISPQGVWCKENGNSFLPFGMDEVGNIKSLSDPTHVWYEEANQIEEADADVLSTSLRSSVPGAQFQEIYSFNPDHAGDYKTFWLWKKFFKATGHPDGTSFRGTMEVKVDAQLVRVPYTVAHSTYRGNPWCPPTRAATYEAYGRIIAETGEMVDAYRYRVWCLGLWATKQTGNEFFPAFNRGQHVAPTPYLPGLPIMQSWDANSLPYCAMLCAQPLRTAAGLHIRIFQEYALRSPNSGLGTTARQFLVDRTARGWAGSDVLLTGDATLRARKTGDGNQSNFKDIEAAMLPALNQSSAALWPRLNTRVMASRDFVNYVLRGGLPGVSVQIDPGCVELIADLELSQLGIDGIHKELYTDKELGVRYQLRGHMADNTRYLLTTLLQAEYQAFLAVREG